MGHPWLARAGSVRPVLWAGGQGLNSARRQAMFERFTGRARRVVVLAQEEARMLNHNCIGTEHLLLGLLREGDGVAPQVLVRLGADLNRVRQRVIQLSSGQQTQPDREAMKVRPRPAG
jgi:ATP-dependent Clp protease ATP-binding subunit ClpA